MLAELGDRPRDPSLFPLPHDLALDALQSFRDQRFGENVPAFIRQVMDDMLAHNEPLYTAFFATPQRFEGDLGIHLRGACMATYFTINEFMRTQGLSLPRVTPEDVETALDTVGLGQTDHTLSALLSNPSTWNDAVRALSDRSIGLDPILGEIPQVFHYGLIATPAISAGSMATYLALQASKNRGGK